MSNLEKHFSKFRAEIIGIDETFKGPYGEVPLIYADWIASGRLYGPIEKRMQEVIGPMVGNTHSESSETGRAMTHAYHLANRIIKKHVNADENDVLITAGAGMTAVINKLQRILGLKAPCMVNSLNFENGIPCERVSKEHSDSHPVVFVTHMEHHSNHTSWLETIADVIVLQPTDDLKVRSEELEIQLEKYKNRKIKIGAFSGCSNVTGLFPPYRELSRIMHRHGGISFIDFAASAPYVDIDMHPENDPDGYLDGIVFSPHKFLGGPGTSGVLVFNSKLYNSKIPDNPGGGTVSWTNRWGERSYHADIEAREDGGTPGFLQAMRAAMVIDLKNSMGVASIAERETELMGKALACFRKIPELNILGDNNDKRIGVISFNIEDMNHNLIVRMLNDRYGIQVRGGCSCAGTYGHYLLHVTKVQSEKITEMIDHGDLSLKPGWVRISFHPTMSNKELDYILDSVETVIKNRKEWAEDYYYHDESGEYVHKTWAAPTIHDFEKWFKI
ncbi:MAG: aminotransferase class V-fold PLP-dependent enzyme [Spirochaetales bacterium]|nr:aminotransferase class V-fold PLP-dependent enzyme [Spirochaetales bacterium]